MPTPARGQSPRPACSPVLPRVAIVGSPEEGLTREIRGILATSSQFPEESATVSSPIILAGFAALADLLLHLTRAVDYPDLVLLAEAWQGEFTTEEVDDLFERLPLARIVVVLGPWVESSGRNGSVWPPAVRCRLRELKPRIERELEIIRGNESLMPLPLTATRDEVFQFETAHLEAPGLVPDFRAVVVATDPAIKSWLSDCARCLGGEVVEPFIGSQNGGKDRHTPADSQEPIPTGGVTSSPPRNIDLGLIDLDALTADEFDQSLRELSDRSPFAILAVTAQLETTRLLPPEPGKPCAILSRFLPLDEFARVVRALLSAARC